MHIAKRWVAGLALAGTLPFVATTAFAGEFPPDSPGPVGTYQPDPLPSAPPAPDPGLPGELPTVPGFPGGPATELPTAPGFPDLPGNPGPAVLVFPDAAMLQSEDVGGVAITDVSVFDLPADHPLAAGWDTDSTFPDFSAARFRHATLANGHEVYQAVYRFSSPASASTAAAAFRGFLASRDDDQHYTVVSTDEWGAGSTVFGHGRDDEDTYLVAPGGPAVVFVMDIGADPGSGDLATVTELGPKAVERARTGITDGTAGSPMEPPRPDPQLSEPVEAPAGE